jgi:hypothetical protein
MRSPPFSSPFSPLSLFPCLSQLVTGNAKFGHKRSPSAALTEKTSCWIFYIQYLCKYRYWLFSKGRLQILLIFCLVCSVFNLTIHHSFSNKVRSPTLLIYYSATLCYYAQHNIIPPYRVISLHCNIPQHYAIRQHYYLIFPYLDISPLKPVCKCSCCQFFFLGGGDAKIPKVGRKR